MKRFISDAVDFFLIVSIGVGCVMGVVAIGVALYGLVSCGKEVAPAAPAPIPSATGELSPTPTDEPSPTPVPTKKGKHK